MKKRHSLHIFLSLISGLLGAGLISEIYTVSADQSPETASSFFIRLAQAAEERTKHHIIYDGAYVKLDYPGGDVAPDRGVCTDVVIRSYRAVGIDLQVEVHEDMKAHFEAYPDIWGLTGPDTSIDHRRVPNLMTFFSRHGTVLSKERDGGLYKPGDIVSWDLGGGLTHIGVVSSQISRFTGRPLLVHNIGSGPRLEDVLFNWKITGHYRYEK